MALDIRFQGQTPDYRLPPEVLALLAQAVQQKNQTYQKAGQTFADVGTGALQGRAQAQFARALQGQSQPVQGPATEAGQKPQQPPPNYTAIGALFQNAYPGQQNPFFSKMMETPFQQQMLQLRAMTEMDRRGESDQRTEEMKRHNMESERLRGETIDQNAMMKQLLMKLNTEKFNAGQDQKAATQNKGIGGWLRGLLNTGVKPSTVPVPGGSARDDIRKRLGLP